MNRNKETIIVLLFTSIVLPFGLPCFPFLQSFGLFVGWEFGALIQTYYTFIKFAFDNPPPHVSNNKHRKYILIIQIPIFLSVAFYILIKTKILETNIIPSTFNFWGKNFIITLFGDAITLIPMFVFFCFNVLFYVQIKRILKSQTRNQAYKHYLGLLKIIISTIDLPCIIPYIIVIVFTCLYSSVVNFDWEAYISGAGSLLLMVSNILTLSVHVLKENKSFYT